MPHTSGRYQQGLGFNDGVIMINANRAIGTGDLGTLTRNAAGDYSLNWINNKAAVLAWNLGDGQLFRTGYTPDVDLQEQYGGAGVPADAAPQGYPGGGDNFYTVGAQLQPITPRTLPRTKGMKLLSVALIYIVGTNNLQLATCEIDKTVHANGVAPAVTNILASAANGLSVVAAATPYVIEVPIPAALSAIYSITDLSQYWFETALTSGAAGGSTMQVYGIRVKVAFNFN